MKIDELEKDAEDFLTDDYSQDYFDDCWDGRWEYAFESLTERSSRFRSNMPFK